MSDIDKKNHWDTIYNSKKNNEMSWFEDVPTISLQFIKELEMKKYAKIIDIGGGESTFVDSLVKMGFTDITVLDISEVAIEKAKIRLGANSTKVKWIVADFTTFVSSEKYDFAHDRAVFHFMTTELEIQKYIHSLTTLLHSLGVYVIGTFSDEGPKKCSGIEIKQYNETALENVFKPDYKMLKSFRSEHLTPSGTIQKFIQASFIKKI